MCKCSHTRRSNFNGRDDCPTCGIAPISSTIVIKLPAPFRTNCVHWVRPKPYTCVGCDAPHFSDHINSISHSYTNFHHFSRTKGRNIHNNRSNHTILCNKFWHLCQQHEPEWPTGKEMCWKVFIRTTVVKVACSALQHVDFVCARFVSFFSFAAEWLTAASFVQIALSFPLIGSHSLLTWV